MAAARFSEDVWTRIHSFACLVRFKSLPSSSSRLRSKDGSSVSTNRSKMIDLSYRYVRNFVVSYSPAVNCKLLGLRFISMSIGLPFVVQYIWFPVRWVFSFRLLLTRLRQRRHALLSHRYLHSIDVETLSSLSLMCRNSPLLCFKLEL
jgi:hypothetical protein